LARKAETNGKLLVPVSWGELIDKITILEIKAERIKKRSALANVRRELDALNAVVGANAPRRAGLAKLKSSLRKINLALWEIEDEIRLKEGAATFDAGFVKLARAVYQTNDRRAEIKREINDLLGSEVVEEKHYARY
jgi:predicted  nucleic acid-binding Zn-ribbon protein